MEVRRDGFSIVRKKDKPIGGLGDLAVGLEDGIYGDECPSLASVDRNVDLATTFEEGFAAIIKAGLAGLAYSVLMPYLDRLQDKFLTPKLVAATESGKCSPCASHEEIKVAYRRLFDSPNPGFLHFLVNPEDYAKFSNEPSAVARNIFSDLFPCNSPMRKLTEQEYEIFSGTRFPSPLDLFTVSYTNMLMHAESINREIVSRFEKAGIPAIGHVKFINGDPYPDHHFDIVPTEQIRALIPLTNTIGTILRSCQSEEWCEPDTKATDLENTPRLEQGDAQFFHGRLVMHEGPQRAKGDVWILMILENKEKLTIREVIDRLSSVKN